MNKQEFEKHVKEMQEKLNKAVDLMSMECMITQLGYTVRMDDVIKSLFMFYARIIQKTRELV